MDMEKWNKCKVKELPIDITGMPVYVGFDMSAKIDLTSVAFIIPFLDGSTVKYIIFSHSFIPNSERLITHKREDKMPYDAWERNGWVSVTDTPVIDQNQVMEYVRKFCAKYDLQIIQLCFDPDNATKLMLELSAEFDVIDVYQNYRSLNECTKTFREEVYNGNWNLDVQCSPFQASYIDDVIKNGTNEKVVIPEEKAFDCDTITLNDVTTYGI